MGTVGYLSPEQVPGPQDEIDPRSDLFAVGAVLFRAITGRKVHQKETEFDTTLAAMKDPAPSFATVVPSAGRALVRAIDGALAFNKADRWQTAEAMFDALRLAYEELGRRPLSLEAGPASRPNPADAPTALSVSVSVTESEPSLVVDVAFGSNHDEAIALERARSAERMREIAPEASRAVDADASTVDDEGTDRPRRG
jgi:eukaryotic-like serine/threonine-protein kinase